jgi:hypothetical protein
VILDDGLPTLCTDPRRLLCPLVSGGLDADAISPAVGTDEHDGAGEEGDEVHSLNHAGERTRTT